MCGPRVAGRAHRTHLIRNTAAARLAPRTQEYCASWLCFGVLEFIGALNTAPDNES